MLDPNAITQGVVTSMVADRVRNRAENIVREATDTPPPKKSEEYLSEIHLLLVELLAVLKPMVQGDVYKFVHIYKAGFGPPYKPSHLSDRQHFTLFCPIAVVLNCSGSGLGAFNISLPAATWNVIDFPDNSQYILDATAPQNDMVFWQRETNQDVT